MHGIVKLEKMSRAEKPICWSAIKRFIWSYMLPIIWNIKKWFKIDAFIRFLTAVLKNIGLTSNIIHCTIHKISLYVFVAIHHIKLSSAILIIIAYIFLCSIMCSSTKKQHVHL